MALHSFLPLLSPRYAAALALFAVATAASAADPIGKAVFARGAVTGTASDGGVQVLGKDTPLSEGDVITTGKKSFAVLELNDGTRMSLRPETVFKVEQYREAAGSESATMRLFKGGLRTITGFISKRNASAYRLSTSVATIGIRGTEFDARLCDEACREEAAKTKPKDDAATSKVVGRVAYLRGALTALGADAKSRPIILGAPLYEGDQINTSRDGSAVLAFRDETRVTLAADSGFAIEAAKFNRADPGDGSAVFKLLRGGLRAVTGLVAKRNPGAVRFNTPVATIGIRGTGFDLQCQGTCSGRTSSQSDPLRNHHRLFGWLALLIPSAHAQTPPDGLYARVWQGQITLFFGNQQQELNQDQVGFLNALNGQFKLVPALPTEFSAPRPDQVPIDQQQLFEVKAKADVEPGLYVSCYEGHCSMETPQETVELGAGEAAFTGGEGAGADRIEPPAVLQQDPYFQTADPNMQPLLETIGGEGGSDVECTF